MQSKQANTNQIKKIDKTLTITTKQVSFAKRMYITIPEHNKKQNVARNNCARPGSDTEANVQTTKHAKVRVWAPKSGKQCTKALQKIRQVRNCIC